MESVHGLPREQSELIGVVRGVRSRYRAKRVLRGAAITIAGSWLILAAAAYTMNRFKYSDASVLSCRVIAILAILALIIRFIVLPLRPRFGDQQVALYLEEHERSLKATVITAVEMHSKEPVVGVQRSPAMINRLTRAALDRVHKANDGRT